MKNGLKWGINAPHKMLNSEKKNKTSKQLFRVIKVTAQTCNWSI